MNELLRSLPNTDVTTHARCGSIIEWWYTGHATTCGFFDETPAGQKQPIDYKNVTAPTPLIVPILESLLPNLIVVETGGNYLGLNNLEYVKKDIGNLILEISKLKTPINWFIASLLPAPKVECVWVGPPAHRIPQDPKASIEANAKMAADFKEKMAALVLAIKGTVEPTCEFFDSTQVTDYPLIGGDGTHYSFPVGIPIANSWAEKAFEVVKPHYTRVSGN